MHEIDFRKGYVQPNFSPTQTIRAKVLGGGELMENRVNGFLRELCMSPGAEIISVTQCDKDAVLILYRIQTVHRAA